MLSPVFKLNDGRAGVLARARFDQPMQLEEVERRDGFGERQLAREDGWNADLVGVDVHIRRDD